MTIMFSSPNLAIQQTPVSPILVRVKISLNKRRRRHRRRSSVNFRRARHFYPKNMYEKLTKCPNFTWFLPEKLTKFPNFTRYLPQNARILHDNCPKKYFPDFFRRGGGHVPRPCPIPPSSTPMRCVLSEVTLSECLKYDKHCHSVTLCRRVNMLHNHIAIIAVRSCMVLLYASLWYFWGSWISWPAVAGRNLGWFDLRRRITGLNWSTTVRTV